MTNIVKSYHMSVGIYGLEERLNNGDNVSFIEDGNGNPLTHQELRELIEEWRGRGCKVIPMCDFYDEQGRCKGHPKSEE